MHPEQNSDDEDISRNKLGHEEEENILNELDPPTGVNEDRAMRKAIRESEVHNAGFETSQVGNRTNKLGGKLTNTGAGFEQVGDSKQGKARDSLTSEVSGRTEKLGGELTNDGGMWEEFADSNAGKADDSLQDKVHENGLGGQLKNKGGQWEKANKGRMSEGRLRDQDRIAEMMDSPEIDLQSLFDTYANQSSTVCLEDFRALCDTYELPDNITEGIFLSLMDANREFLFQEGRDNGGTYWTAVPLLSEELGTAGVADQPVGMGDMMSRRMHAQRTTSGKVAPKGENDDQDTDPEAVAGLEESCPRCGNAADALGCPSCELLRESNDLGFSKTADASNKSGILKPAKQSEPSKPAGRINGVETHESKSGKAEDGFTKQMNGGRGDTLDPEVTNDGGQFEELKGGKKAVEENVSKLALAVKRGIDSCLNRLQPGRYSVSYVVEGSGVTKTRRSLTEALLDSEELMQAFGKDNVRFSANFYLNNSLVRTESINLPSIRRRAPLVSEGKVLFRFKEVAGLFARAVLGEGKACRMCNHNWGAAVAGRFGWNVATKAFATINEAWGTQVRTAEQEAIGPFQPGMRQTSLGQGDDEIDIRYEPPMDAASHTNPEFDEQEVGNHFNSQDGEGEEGEDDAQDEFIPGGGYNPEAPGAFDVEGQLCPECGSSDYASDIGTCPECGQPRAGGSNEIDFGPQDQGLEGSDEFGAFENEF